MNMNDAPEKSGRAGHFFTGAILGGLSGMVLAGIFGSGELGFEEVAIFLASVGVWAGLGAKFGDRLWVPLVLGVVMVVGVISQLWSS